MLLWDQISNKAAEVTLLWASQKEVRYGTWNKPRGDSTLEALTARAKGHSALRKAYSGLSHGNAKGQDAFGHLSHGGLGSVDS